MTEEKGMLEYIKEIQKALQEKKVKEQKIPWRARLGRRRIRQGWASVLYIKNNKSVDFLKAPIEDNTIKIGDLTHEATPDDILIYKGKPMLIIPEWREKPIRPWRAKEDYEEADEQDGLTTTQRHIISKLEQGTLSAKKKISTTGWVMLGIGVIALFYFFSQGGLS